MRLSKLKRGIGSLVKRLDTRRTKKIALISIGGLIVLVLLVQIFYPRDRALMGTTLSTSDIGGWTVDDISKLASELYARSTLEGAGANKTMLARNLSAVGVKIDFDAVADQATDYSWWLRLVPTSIFWAGQSVGAVDATIDQGQLDAYVADSESSFEIAPENAKLVVDDQAPTEGGIADVAFEHVVIDYV